jgi:hypothetical protein
MNSDFRDPNYNPMMGAGRTGRVQKDEFSIDGKSWNYRDPYNQEQIRRQNLGSERENDTINEHSSTMTNPLYDYSYGQTRDAAKALGIGNVDEQEEVDRLIEYIQNPKTVETEVPVETPKEDEIIPPDEMPNPNAELSPGYQRSKDLLDSRVGSIIDGTFNDSIMNQPAGTTAAKMNNTSTVPEETSSPFDTSEFLNNFKQNLADKMNFKPNFPFGS